ncbi:hypothetical protein GSI_03112 [Ganoderma sinense ZZ0214-1]|uniref:Uncharacterized protein n=1 Tax=Ganoderma sinense ZZ0214-1 TaxID=1077348 RepID=A0A2G8SKR1_9APHY|nr:hypothetical protein GSI_03112 [Ganoderma sinense ZZ0214-1]
MPVPAIVEVLLRLIQSLLQDLKETRAALSRKTYQLQTTEVVSAMYQSDSVYFRQRCHELEEQLAVKLRDDPSALRIALPFHDSQ